MRIGYAPGACLRSRLMELGHLLAALSQAGLVTPAGYDAYVHRIVFPLEGNLYGRSISASAPPHRFLPGSKGGLYRWDEVRRYREVILVEGHCLRSTGPDQWAVHVPLGKLKTERLVPVDPFVCKFAQRLRFFRSLERLPNDGFLLPRPRSKEALIRQLRDYLHQVCHEIGLPTRIVPHQFRHTYASEMLRAGVGLPALMNLLGHVDPDMTMRYLDVTLTDLKREFHLARSKPRHLTPQPNPPVVPLRTGLAGVIHALAGAQHVLEMFPPDAVRRRYALLPRPTLQSAHKNHRRGKVHRAQLNPRLRQRLAGKAPIRTEQQLCGRDAVYSSSRGNGQHRQSPVMIQATG
jgi:hypothetical protein